MNFFRIRKAALLSCCLLAAIQAWSAERVIERSFTLDQDGEVIVKVSGGDVDVTTGEGNKVMLRAVLRGSQSSVDRFAFDFEEGNSVVRILQRKNYGNNWFKNLKVKVDLIVPRQSRLDVRTSGGDVRVADLDGTVSVRSSGGDLSLGRIGGPVLAATSGGDIDVDWINGDAELRSSGGSIRARGVEGDLVAKTSGGNVHVGNIDGRIQASSSGGNIKMHLVGPNRGIDARTSGGNILLEADPELTGALDARTSGGRVVSDFDVTIRGSVSKNRIAGIINGGSETIRLRTSGGRIELRQASE